jgi:hypothetical protein
MGLTLIKAMEAQILVNNPVLMVYIIYFRRGQFCEVTY